MCFLEPQSSRANESIREGGGRLRSTTTGSVISGKTRTGSVIGGKTRTGSVMSGGESSLYEMVLHGREGVGYFTDVYIGNVMTE